MSVRSLRRGSIAASRGPAGTPTTYTIFSDPAHVDGYISAAPSTADGGASAGNVVQTGDIFVGQQVGAAYEGFLAFNTSSVVGTITAVTLSLWGVNDSSTTDFTVEARIYNWGTTLTEADWRSPASLAALTLVASRSTASGWSTSGYNAFTSDPAFLTNINQAGTTRLIICSSRHRAGNTPSGNEFVGFRSVEQAGTTNDPKLVIDALV